MLTRPTAPDQRHFVALRVLLVLCLTSLVACSAAIPSPSVSSPSSSSSAGPMTAVASNGSVRVTLTLEEPPRNDAVTWAQVTIENLADRGVRWAGGGCGDPGSTAIDVSAIAYGRADWPGRLGSFKERSIGAPGPAGSSRLTVGYVPESQFGKNVACPAVLAIETLPAGGSFRYRAAWDGLFQGQPAPAGPATVLATFPFIGLAGLVPPEDFHSTDVTASIPTSIVGPDGAGGLSPGLAIDAALADPAFAAFVNEAPEVTWTNPDVSRIDGIWHVGLFRSGADQSELNGYVLVDATGHIAGGHFDR